MVIFVADMRKNTFAFLFITVVLLSACSEYNKVLKSSDLDYKLTKAIEYLEEERCYQALPIFEELIALTRGSQRAEKVYYYHAKSHYCGKDYYMANYYFNNFIKNYSFSEHAEECQFLAAKCSYNLSPNYSLDQTDTKLALTELQLFIDKYPNSSLRDSCQNMMTTLNQKLEKKSYEIAKLYVKTERYNSAAIALRNAVKDFPASPYREEMMFLMVKSSYLYASKSVIDKKTERFTEAIDHYFNFVAYFPESKWLKQAESYYESSRKELERLKMGNANS
jgi:outer membrane protein assembly factor BamD